MEAPTHRPGFGCRPVREALLAQPCSQAAPESAAAKRPKAARTRYGFCASLFLCCSSPSLDHPCEERPLRFALRLLDSSPVSCSGVSPEGCYYLALPIPTLLLPFLSRLNFPDFDPLIGYFPLSAITRFPVCWPPSHPSSAAREEGEAQGRSGAGCTRRCCWERLDLPGEREHPPGPERRLQPLLLAFLGAASLVTGQFCSFVRSCSTQDFAVRCSTEG